MPTIHREAGYRFQIYSQDHPPPHVHVKAAGCEAKVMLSPVSIARNAGFPQSELSRIMIISRRRAREFEKAWHGLFGESEG